VGGVQGQLAHAGGVRQGPGLEALLERAGEPLEPELAAEEEDLGEAAVAVGSRERQVAGAQEDRVGAREGGAAERRSRLAREGVEVVGQLEHGRAARVAARVRGDEVRSAVELDPVDEALGAQRRPGAGDRHRVAYAVDVHHRDLVGHHRAAHRGREGAGGQLAEGSALQPPGIGVAGPFSLAPGAQVPVQIGEVRERARDRHERVPAYVADEVLDRALLVAGARRAEAALEQVVSAQGAEALVLFASRPGKDLGDRGLGVVVPKLGGHAPEELEGRDVAGEEGLEPLRRVGGHEGYLGGLGAQAEEGDLGAHPGDRHHGAAEVGLRDLAEGGFERHEGLAGTGAAQTRDRLADGDLGAGEAVLADQAVVDAPRRVALLSRRRLVVGEPLPHHVEVGTHDR